MNKLKRAWSNLQTSFWFMPSLIVAVSIALAQAFIEADFTGSEQWWTSWPRLFGAGAAGARGMLSTIVGSMMTVVVGTFSMTLVTLALASSQYTSRILRNFMRDRLTQIVLGIFAGIFTYCLIVLRTIRDGEEGGFVPSLAVSFGIRQIVDMALRALSTGSNDTTTAVICVDYLRAILGRLVSRNIPSSRRYAEGQLRVITLGPTFAGLTASTNQRRALREQVEWIAESAERTIESPHDRSRFETRLARVREALE